MSKPSPLFGPAGRAESFAQQGYKRMDEVPRYLAGFGLTAFEYQCGHGVRVNEATLAVMKAQGPGCGITYSLHAPYYISMASLDEQKRQNSLTYLLQSAHAVNRLGGNRVIFHCGGQGKQPRPQALAKVQHTLAAARQLLDDEGLAHVHLCPETMGKAAQMGSLEEVLLLCRQDARHIPCLDMGHLNALWQGRLRTEADFAAVTAQVADALPDERAAGFHVHFSKIEYTKAGEKRHLTFADEVYGPPFEPFIALVARQGLAPTIICESAGTQSEDAATMMRAWQAYAATDDTVNPEYKPRVKYN